MVNNTAKWYQGEEKKSGEEEGKGRGGVTRVKWGQPTPTHGKLVFE